MEPIFKQSSTNIRRSANDMMPLQGSAEWSNQDRFRPRIDMAETDEELILFCELPGMICVPLCLCCFDSVEKVGEWE